MTSGNLLCVLIAAIALASPGYGAESGTEPNGLEAIEIGVGDFVFDALAAGPEDGELVLLLHGFPQTGYSFRHQLRALGAAGYRAVAPDQRGYSPRARPSEVSAYGMTQLVGDVIGIAAALGRERFHLVGHDWGGAVAWVTATFQPQRVLTLTVLSTPHFQALAQSYSQPDSDQAQRSSYFSDFGAEGSEAWFLADDMAQLRSILAGSGASDEDLGVYLERLGSPEAMRAALNWYSALIASRAGSAAPPTAAAGPTSGSGTRVPTLYLWGSEDSAFGSSAAQSSADFVVAPYQFHILAGYGHWLPEEADATVTRLLLDHLASSYPDLGHDSPDRRFDPEARSFVSVDSPALELPIPERYEYLGRLEFPLEDVAWVDRHLFADLDGTRIRSLVVLQFEGYLDGAEGRYHFGVPSAEQLASSNHRFSPKPIELGDEAFIHNTWAFDWRAGAAENPGAESDRTLRYLEGRGLEVDDGWIMSRYVRSVGPDGRGELILFYLVPLASRGHSLAAFPDGGPSSESYDELSGEISRQAVEIFESLRQP